MRLRNCRTNEVEIIWQAPPLDADANLQFFFGAETCLLNYQCPEMSGIVAPTDSRFRMDMRLMEEGEIDEAEDEKVAIEVGQRQRRKQLEQDQALGKSGPYKPKFFVQEDHPLLKNNDVLDSRETKPVRWRLIEGEQSYWSRRERGDWSDMPRIWGPFDTN